MITAFFLISISFLLCGPSKVFHFPDELWILVIGLALDGSLIAFTFIPACPEMVESS